jgi:hypothetical protein
MVMFKIDVQAITDRIAILQDAVFGAKIGTRAVRRDENFYDAGNAFKAGVRFLLNMPQNQRQLAALKAELTPLYAAKAHLRGRLHGKPSLTPQLNAFTGEKLPLTDQSTDFQEAFALQEGLVADTIQEFTVPFSEEEKAAHLLKTTGITFGLPPRLKAAVGDWLVALQLHEESVEGHAV